MPSYLQIENISKSYGPKVLFDHIAFNINEGDKIALIAPNGTGKTSLLRIIAGKDSSDSGGKVLFLKDIRIAFLEQEYLFDPELTVIEQVHKDSLKWTEHLSPEHLSEYEIRINKLVTSFHLNSSMKMKDLSGGEVKRVALVVMLASEADFYVMDEPTNHLDIDAIEFLEDYLTHARCTLLMVTHDRYFLDSVANIVMGELEWMHSSPCARTGKAKYRKNAFYELKDRAEQVYRSNQMDLSEMGGASRLGTKIINCKDVSFFYGGKCYLSHFSYNFQRYEKVGIVGGNGVGKSTFVNILLNNLDPADPGMLTGTIERGESLNIGYYKQTGMSFDEDQTVLETVNDTHLLGQFLFSHDMLNNRVGSLSGGERRRLYLLTILMKQPNLLVMDEPTNDLDIVTINILEEYLKDFKGSLIIVSHDRHFLDRLVDHLFVFCGDGVVKDFIGSYSQYNQYLKDYKAAQRAQAREAARSSKIGGASKSGDANEADRGSAPKRKRLSYKEQKELEQLEKDIASLTTEKTELEAKLNGSLTDYEEIQKATSRFGEVSAELDAKETRWLELSI